MIRAFIGIRLDPDITRRICEAQSQLQHSLKGIRWVKRDHLHLTLKFLGEIGEDKVLPVVEAVERAVRSRSRFSFACRGMGVFPDIRRARVLWVGLEAEELARLATAVETSLEAIGFAREKREFKPHLTIGRWRNFDGRPEVFRAEIVRWKGHDFGASWANEVVFFQSVIKPEGAVYTPLKVIPLGEKPN